MVASGPPGTPGEEQRFTLRFQIQLQWPHDLTRTYDTSTRQCSSSILCHPAVREQIDAVNTTAVVRCQEKYGFGHFFNRTGSPKRNVRDSAFTAAGFVLARGLQPASPRSRRLRGMRRMPQHQTLVATPFHRNSRLFRAAQIANRRVALVRLV